MDFDCFWLKFLIRNKLGNIEEEKRATTGFFVSSAVQEALFAAMPRTVGRSGIVDDKKNFFNYLAQKSFNNGILYEICLSLR